MKRKFTCLLLCTLTLSMAAQEREKEEIIKKGWNFGPLPVVGWDSDLGFQYGACVDIFNYGDGTNYPSYDYKVNLEASTYTGGSSLFRCYGDFKTLIPDGKLFFDCTYFNSKKFDFFGYNGFSSPYFGSDYMAAEGDKSEFYWMRRNQFRFVTSLQKRIKGNLYWAAGLGYYNIYTNNINLDDYDGQKTL